MADEIVIDLFGVTPIRVTPNLVENGGAVVVEGAGQAARIAVTTQAPTTAGVTDHGALTGLADNDHPQYLLASSTDYVSSSDANWLELTGGGETALHSHAGGSTDSGGALVLLEQHTATDSTSLDFTTAIDATYDEYLFELIDIVPATDAADLAMQVSTDGGTSYDSSTDYACTVFFYYGTYHAATPAAETGVYIAGSVSNSASYGVSGHIRLVSPGAAKFKWIYGESTDYDAMATDIVHNTINAVYKNTSAVNAVRFIFSSGNIASGTIRCYGIAKS